MSDSTGRFKYKSEQLFDHFSYAQGFDVFAACISPRLLGKNNEKVGVAFTVWICNNSLFEPLFTLPIGTIGVTVDKDTGVFIYEYGRDDIVGVINQEGVPIFAQEGSELKQQEIMSFPKAMQIVMEYVTIEL